MPEKIAIDIILLPSAEITETAVKLNRMLNASTKNYSLILDYDNTLPHISLAMGTLEISDINFLSEEIEKICGRYLPYNAGFKSLAAVKTSDGTIVSGIDLIKDDIISDLQDEIKSILMRYHSGDATEEMIYPDKDKITDFTLIYSSEYLKKSTGRNFSPHITLGNGDIYDCKNIPTIPPFFECKNLAICHLGNHCTCKKIIRIF